MSRYLLPRKVLYIHYSSHLMRYFVCHGNCYLERFNELLTCLTCIGNILDTRAGPFNQLFALHFVHFRVCTSLVNERYLRKCLRPLFHRSSSILNK